MATTFATRRIATALTVIGLSRIRFSGSYPFPTTVGSHTALAPTRSLGEALHVPRQVQLDRAAWLATIRIVEGASEVRITEHTTAIVAKADPRQSW